jgi:hypothetical protein
VSLVCPACGAAHPDEERFCRSCDLPLVAAGGPAEASLDERHARMRKVKRQYAEGELVRVATGRQLPEAELIQNLLLDEGVPSTLRRTRGFDVPEMLAAGPRDVLVPQSGVVTAREVLLEAEMLPAATDVRAPASPGRVLAWLLGSVAGVGLIVLAIDLLMR